MRKRSAARLGRALLVLPVAAVSQQLLANTGVQIPLSQYQAGSEQTTLLPNGNFNVRENNDADPLFETATGWTRNGSMYVDATVNPPANSAATSPFSAQARQNGLPPSAAEQFSYTQSYNRAGLTANGNYVLSGYVWNDGRYDTSGFGGGELVSLKVQDPTNALTNISATVEARASDGASAHDGRFVYILFNEEQVSGWGGFEVAAVVDVGSATTGADGTPKSLPEIYAQWDNLAITPASQFALQRWQGGGADTNWGTGGNWADGLIPNQASAVATLASNAAAQTVTLESGKTVGILRLDSAAGYTVNGAGTLTLDVSEDGGHVLQGVPEIQVVSGNHTIAAPVVFDTTLDVDALSSVKHDPQTHPFNAILNVIPAASTLTIANLDARGVHLAKRGAGTAEVNHVRTIKPAGGGDPEFGGGLNVAAGTLKITPNAGAAGVSKVTTLAIGADARLDLTNNKLITDTPVGTFTGGAYSGVQGEVARAYNFGAWDQPGLTTSEQLAGPNAGPLSGTTTIGVASAEQVMFLAPTDTGIFLGQTVTGASTIAMYTYAGDVNFDGLVDAADYGVIDNWVQFPGTDGYANGDLNYDGVIDAGDYGIIDNTIQLQGPQIPGWDYPYASSAQSGASLSGVTAVPEPTAIGLAVVAAGVLLGRRRRRVR
jgi:hypothetical protein